MIEVKAIERVSYTPYITIYDSTNLVINFILHLNVSHFLLLKIKDKTNMYTFTIFFLLLERNTNSMIMLTKLAHI